LGNWNFSPSQRSVPPAFGDPLPLQHEMGEAALLQPVAHHEPGLAAADDERLDVFNRHGAELYR
jgi:trimethylamine:corrinoid methyltransferase-like protein